MATIRKYNKFGGNADEVLQALNSNKDWVVISIANNGATNSFVVFYYTEQKSIIQQVEPITL